VSSASRAFNENKNKLTPFHRYQILFHVHKVAPAIAAGNSVVLKPSPQTPMSAEFLGGIFNNAGLPAGMFNIVQGDSEIGEALVTDPLVRMVLFTGSVRTGHLIALKAGMKKSSLELGGKDAQQ